MSELKLRGKDVTWTDVDGEIVALDEAAAVYLAANETGGLLWRALADGTTRQALVTTLTDAYDVTAEQAQTDTDTFLAALRERDLLEEQ